MKKAEMSRRAFATTTVGLIAVSSGTSLALGQGEGKKSAAKKSDDEQDERHPVEASFERDYEPPSFKPGWKKPQVNRLMAQDFVIFAHSDLKMVETLYNREPGLLNATLDWGNGDWETALGGASHMGRRDIVEFLLSKGARIDLFCATMMGLLDSVKSMLTLQPSLIDAKGPHGFNLHWHAQVGQEQAKPVLDYLQSIKELELRPVPFLKKKKKIEESTPKPADKAGG